MTDRPILFSGPMVRALLAGRKTQTHRLLNPQPKVLKNGVWYRPFSHDRSDWQYALGGIIHAYAKVPVIEGDSFYVCETHYRFGHWEPVATKRTKAGRQKWKFVEDTSEVLFDAPASYRKGRHHQDPGTPAWHKRLGRFMFRRYSRLTLTVTDVRIERLQNISEADAIAEGATCRPKSSGFGSMSDGWSMDWSPVGTFSKWATGGPGPLTEGDISLGDPVSAFAGYINELHGGPRWNITGPILWDINPWVVAYGFSVHHGNIDQIARAA